MCGIIGYIGEDSTADILLNGLKRMEYRGYDSAGIATIEESKVKTTKAVGAVEKLEQKLRTNMHEGKVGIGHTRWATHGVPSDGNAHPHTAGKITLVHNGIIENYLALKTKLVAEGYKFKSETDSEILAAYIDSEYKKYKDPYKTLQETLSKVRGTFGLCILFADRPNLLVAARRSSPVLVAQGKKGVFVASDQYALAGQAKQAIALHEDEIALCSPNNIEIRSLGLHDQETELIDLAQDEQILNKGAYQHFMYKEILEQPESVARTLSGRVNHLRNTAQFGGLNIPEVKLKSIDSLLFVGCGTAYHAGLTAKYLLEPILQIPIQVEVASELRYRMPALGENSLAVAISQSGETADTLACIEELKHKRIPVLGVVNVVGSSIARLVDGGIYTHAGPEIAVASTKAYSSQIVALLLLGLRMARLGNMSSTGATKYIKGLESLPKIIAETLKIEPAIKPAADVMTKQTHLMVLGRDNLFPVSLETALKIKEISYIPTSGYPAGEMKHGPNALLGKNMGVIFMLAKGELYDKSLSNLAEVRARSANLVVMTDEPSFKPASGEKVIFLPESPSLVQPLVFAIAGQLLSYFIAMKQKTEIDKPRNLAKSVTVE